MHFVKASSPSGVATANRPEDGNSVDCAHRLATAERLLAELETLDILLEVEGELLSLYPPESGISDELLDRVRAQKPGLLQLLRSETPSHEVAALNLGEDSSKPDESPPHRGMFHCPWCGPEKLSDESKGMQCCRCSRLAWVAEEDGSLTRADMLDVDPRGLLPDEIDQCQSCGDLCDTETGTDEWACSRCDLLAAQRRKMTSRMLELRERLRAEHRRFSKVSQGR